MHRVLIAIASAVAIAFVACDGGGLLVVHGGGHAGAGGAGGGHGGAGVVPTDAGEMIDAGEAWDGCVSCKPDSGVVAGNDGGG